MERETCAERNVQGHGLWREDARQNVRAAGSVTGSQSIGERGDRGEPLGLTSALNRTVLSPLTPLVASTEADAVVIAGSSITITVREALAATP